MPMWRATSAYRGPDRRSHAGNLRAGYRGADRRATATLTRDLTTTLAGAPAVIFAAVLLLMVGLAVRAMVMGGGGLLVTFAAFRDAGAGLLVLSGSVLIVLWGITGRAARALDGSALLLVGGGMLTVAGPWAAWLHANEFEGLLAPGVRLALCLPAIALLARSDTVVPVDSSVHPLRSFTSATSVALGLLGIEAVARTAGPLDRRFSWVVSFIAIGVGWVAVGLRRAFHPEARDRSDCPRAIGCALIAWGVGDFALIWALSGDLRWGVVGAAVQLLGSALSAGAAVSLLLAELGNDSARRLRLAGELADVSNVLADEQSVRQSLLHDARNVVAAIRTANITLERHGDRLDPAVQEQLRDAVGSEFTKLQSLLDPAPPTKSKMTS